MDITCCHSRDIQIRSEHITDLEYADDVVIFVDDYGKMQIMFNKPSITAARIGYTININRTKIFFSSYIVADKIPLFINSLPVEARF